MYHHHPLPHSPNLNLRQSSPYPVESVNITQQPPAVTTATGNNTQRHKNQHGYQQHNKKKPSSSSSSSTVRNNGIAPAPEQKKFFFFSPQIQERKQNLWEPQERFSGDKSETNSTGNYNTQRDHAIGLGSREHSSGTLTSRGRISNRRHQQTNNGMMSSTSSSNSSISDNNDDYHDVDHRRLNLENDLNGDSPPEPAPPEVPPRGPSLHVTGNSHTLRSGRNTNDRTPQGQDIFLSQGE
ncbi:hypothetical protein Phum_PHUM617510 [Pediculus humanus corporis]|uniref:Uncharacterized protein n=1 Tax=Pediculus humanus subsp. corporis TaxID=121224 RepID=E0W4D7_PEDHC|nr:uncharacterized protein Phum_PHUM617510 [Pediculus humanus corporis]EEB20493.1 hypothetical protein Phum_PHUM617510 [Pediculus humanus corporis]